VNSKRQRSEVRASEDRKRSGNMECWNDGIMEGWEKQNPVENQNTERRESHAEPAEPQRKPDRINPPEAGRQD
jgi:hypothetical protein